MKKRLIAVLLIGILMATPAIADEAELLARIEALEQRVEQLEQTINAGPQAVETQEETNVSEVAGIEPDNQQDFVPLENLTYYSEGQYKVGLDFDPGFYMLISTDNQYGGSVRISPDANQDDLTVIALFDYNYIIEVRSDEYIKLSDCRAYKMDDNPAIDMNKAEMMLVGKHLPAGEYKLISTDDSFGGSYRIYGDAREDDLKTIELFDGQAYFSVVDGDYLFLRDCYIDGIQDPTA